MNRLPSAVITACLLLAAPTILAAQKVLIPGATREDVVREVTNQLSGSGLKLEDTTKSEARWGLDRGLINQTSGNGVAQSVPIVLELHVRFKDKKDGLEVTADEEVVGNRGRGNTEFRKPVRSTAEVQNIQQLLDIVKTTLEARAAK